MIYNGNSRFELTELFKEKIGLSNSFSLQSLPCLFFSLRIDEMKRHSVNLQCKIQLLKIKWIRNYSRSWYKSTKLESGCLCFYHGFKKSHQKHIRGKIVMVYKLREKVLYLLSIVILVCSTYLNCVPCLKYSHLLSLVAVLYLEFLLLLPYIPKFYLHIRQQVLLRLWETCSGHLSLWDSFSKAPECYYHVMYGHYYLLPVYLFDGFE